LEFLLTFSKAHLEIQGDSGGKISTFGGDNIGHCG